MELVVIVLVEPRLVTIAADVVAVVVLMVIVVMTAEVGWLRDVRLPHARGFAQPVSDDESG